MFEQRLKTVREKLKEEKLDGLLVSSVSNITYLTGYSNFSKDEREAYLIVGDNFQYIITDGRYTEAIKREVPHFTLFERSHQNKTEDFLKSLKDKINILGFEGDNLTVSEYKKFMRIFKNLKHFAVNKIRSRKNSDEIKKIEKACKIGDLAFEHIIKKIKLGVTEKEIAYQLESFIKDKGAGFSFPAIVAFSKDSAVPHHHTGMDKLTKKGEFVLLDFGVKFENYCSDMTRTIFFGKPTKKQKEIYETVLAVQQKAVEFVNSSIKAGKQIKAAEIDKVARDYIVSKGYSTIPHSLGHGIGLEVHEHPYLSPKSKEVLKMGMVFSIEPGIYIPGFGGVRIEDLFVCEKRGLRQITTSSKNLIEV